MCGNCNSTAAAATAGDQTQIVQVIPAELLHVATELLKLFEANEIGLAGHRFGNWADWYECPSCGAEKAIEGDAARTFHITGVEHKADCKLFALYQHLKKTDEANPVWFAE